MKKISWIILSSLSILLVSLIGFHYLQFTKFETTELVIEEKEFLVKKGTSLITIAKMLESQGVVERYWHLLVLAKLEKLENIKAGLYQFDGKPYPTPAGFLQKLNHGVVKQFSITFVEGWNFREWIREIQNHKHINKTLSPLKQVHPEVMRLLGSYSSAEGWLYPDTYFYESGASDLSIIKTAHQKMKKFLADAWPKRQKDIPLRSPYEALILASIVEKETGAAKERPEIAGVFTRRLNKNMRLETDPTVIYGLGDRFDGDLKRKHLREYTPFNTYRIKGLPPTPIAMPSGDAILAALNPEPGNSLFFVAKGDGTHYFSKTLKEHNKAVRKYQLKKP